MNTRPPLPPFTRESAIEKVRLAEDGWNSRDPAKIALAYSLDTQWRNRAEFATNRQEAQAFLERKWKKELDYRLIKELCCGLYQSLSHPDQQQPRLFPVTH